MQRAASFDWGSLPVVLLTGGTFAASCRTLPGVLETGEANAVELSVSSRVLDLSTQVRQRHSQLTLTSKIQLAPCLSSRVFFLLLRGRRGQFQHYTFCMEDVFAYTGTEGASSSTVAFEDVTQDEFGQCALRLVRLGLVTAAAFAATTALCLNCCTEVLGYHGLS